MLLASFNKNNKEYVVYLIDNKLVYGYMDNNKMNTDLSNEERNFIDVILSNIIISKDEKNHKKCGILKYNNKDFQVMYDKVSKRKFWYEIKDGKFNIPSFEDFNYLASKFDVEVAYENINNVKNNKIYKRLIAGVLVVVTSLSLFYGTYVAKNNSSVSIDYSTMTESTRLAIENLEMTLDNNDNLTKEEKEFVKSNFDIIVDNIDYVDLELINHRLEDLDFVYYDYSSNYGYASYTNENKLEIYDAKNIEQAVSKYGERTTSHELCHTFTTKFKELGLYIHEGLTEIVAREYNGLSLEPDRKGAYVLERSAIYPLIELLGEDVIKSYYFSGEPQVLIDGLTSIINDEDKAYELIGEIDNISFNYFNAFNYYGGYLSLTKEEKMYIEKEVFSKLNNLMNEYYQVKYGHDMVEDEIMKAYLAMQTLNYDSIDTLIEFAAIDVTGAKHPENYMAVGIVKHIEPKVYFSNEYKQKRLSIDGNCVTYKKVLEYYDQGENLIGTEEYINPIKQENKIR